MHVEVIRLALGSAAAFAVLKGPGYRKLIINTDEPPGHPLGSKECERGIAELVAALMELPEQRQEAG